MQKKYIVQEAIIIVFLLSITTTLQAYQIPFSSTIKINKNDTNEEIIAKAAHVIPTHNQYEALKNEYIAFIHYGPNVFTRNEWGDGFEDPKIFNPTNLDTDQWCRVIKEAGMKMVILTAKHHDGFVLWQSRYTKHGVISSAYKNGKGDVVKNLSLSCKKYGLKLGIYLSPADLYQMVSQGGLYGNKSKFTERTIPRKVKGRNFENKTKFKFVVDDYNEYFLNQLFELLTEYGPIHEVWFDGAHPLGKEGQRYNYAAWKTLIKTLAPESVTFHREDIRWCGNESGQTRVSEWNIIPFKEDPRTKNEFKNQMNESLGSRIELYQGNYLHYYPTEINTSIRDGWFYRDDTNQKVRSVDEIFDIYERSVGGNSIFILNIPPNRIGIFSMRDVSVLREVKQIIDKTYSNNLLKDSTAPPSLLDNNIDTFLKLNKGNNSIIITTPKPITINRFEIQEAIKTHSERIEKHVLKAWIDKKWIQIAHATNVGYKRILRFPKVTAKKFKFEVLEYRLEPAISKISAYYYTVRPPQLHINRNLSGMVSISPDIKSYNWDLSSNENNENNENNQSKLQIRYTINGSNPTAESMLYKQPFHFPNGQVKARSYYNGKKGSITTHTFGFTKKEWSIIPQINQKNKHRAKNAIDNNSYTFWQSPDKKNKNYSIKINLGKKYEIYSFAYTPAKLRHSQGLIEKGNIKISENGKSWNIVDEFIFSNIINNPVIQKHFFKKAINTQYIMIEVVKSVGKDNTAAIEELDFFPK